MCRAITHQLQIIIELVNMFPMGKSRQITCFFSNLTRIKDCITKYHNVFDLIHEYQRRIYPFFTCRLRFFFFNRSIKIELHGTF